MTRLRLAVAVLMVVSAVGVLASFVLFGLGAVQSSGSVMDELLSTMDRPANPADKAARAFTIRSGETTTDIAARLETAGLVRSALVFRVMADAEGVAEGLAAGEYDLSPSMQPSEILFILAKGKTRPSPMVTIPEGWRSEEIAERMAARGVGTVDRFMRLVHSERLDLPTLSSRPNGAGLEGYLFPDSYAYDSKSTPDSMIQRMSARFDAQFNADMRSKAAALGLSVHQAVTLASVIEREAVLPSERPLMAGVFYNRLQAGMPLQSDPTVQYAVATLDPNSHVQYGWWKRTLSPADLQVDSPYNSYRYAGLPPGPICNPGLASLIAAVNPTPTDYYYFVARPDGSHAFAKTLEEHNQNVARYR